MDEALRFIRLLWPTTSPLLESLRFTLWRMPGKASQHYPLSGPTLEEALLSVPDAAMRDGPAAPHYQGVDPAAGLPETHTLYYGVGLRESKLGNARGTDDQVHAWPGVWVDLDYGVTGHAGREYPPDEAAALEIADRFPLAPSVVVHSGHGFHLYWLFDQPVLDRKIFTSILTGVQRHFREIAKPYAVDKTDDVGRVLSLPGFWNCKRLVPPKEITIFLDDGPRYRLTAFERFRGQVGRPHKSPPPAADLVVVEPQKVSKPLAPSKGFVHDGFEASSGRALLAVPTPEPEPRRKPGRPSHEDQAARAQALASRPELSSFPGAEGVCRRVLHASDKEKRDRAILVLRGLPFAKAGERNNVCNAVVGFFMNFVFQENPEATPEEIYEAFFARSIQAMAQLEDSPSNPALSEAEVLGQIDRMWRVVVGENERKLTQTARVKEVLNRALLRRSNGTALATRNGSAGNGVAAVPNGAAYSGDTMADFSYPAEPPRRPSQEPPPPSSQETPADLNPFRYLIIQYRDLFWLWSEEEGGYGTRRSFSELEVSMRDAFADVPVEWYYEDANGKTKKKSLTQFRDDYSTVASHVVYDMTQPQTHYETDTSTLTVGVAPVRDLEPVYDENVHEWLTLLGGRHVDKLLDWLATVTDRTRPSCALYLSGPPRAGKSLLLGGLARLWKTHGGGTHLKEVLGNFNTGLRYCPLVFAEEALPKGTETTALRDLIANLTWTVNEKFMPTVELRGSIRLVLTSNEPNMLETVTEHQGQDDVAAVAERFLHIAVDQRPAQFLERLGSRSGTNDWLEGGDRLTKHILWLVHNRSVTPAGRLVVEGEKTEMHLALASAGPVSSWVLQWIVGFLTKPMPNIVQTKGVVYGNGQLMVNASVIYQFWDQYILSTRAAYSVKTIAMALKSMGTQCHTRTGNYWAVEPSHVYHYAKTCGENSDEMRRLIGEPLPEPPPVH